MNSWRSVMSFCLTEQGPWVGGLFKGGVQHLSPAVPFVKQQTDGQLLYNGNGGSDRVQHLTGVVARMRLSLYWVEVRLVGRGVVSLY